jgi:hypothetical protein
MLPFEHEHVTARPGTQTIEGPPEGVLLGKADGGLDGENVVGTRVNGATLTRRTL